MDSWIDLCPASAIPAEGGKYVLHGGRPYAVFLDEAGQPRVMDDTCPHAGASLSAGHLEQGCVTCPWHAWPFDLKSGECPDNPSIAVRVYPSELRAGRVVAKLG